MTSSCLNGLGRFGQSLLHAWLAQPGLIAIDYACDQALTAEAVCALLLNHDRLDFSAAEPRVEDGNLYLTRADAVRQRIDFHHGSAPLAPWLGLAELWLECSGLHPLARDCRAFLSGRTRQVLISATCEDADQTLIMGHNHLSWLPQSRVISYGSCTINAFVPLASWLQVTYGVLEAQVNVIHNLPAHRLAAQPHPVRRSCSLEVMAAHLLPWLSPANLSVNYAVIPYPGASLIDFRFRLKTPAPLQPIIEALRTASSRGPLLSRYSVLSRDPGVSGALGLPLNAVLYSQGISMKADWLQLAGYFDNENSAVRYLELMHWLSTATDKMRHRVCNSAIPA